MIHKNHKALVMYSGLTFLILSSLIAIFPAIEMNKQGDLMQREQGEDDPMKELGRDLYLAEGCATCHTQFVRNLAVDRNYGRGSVASDFVQESPPLLGTQRTGPDLANVGLRQPSETWNLIHLYNPRAVVSTSVMPGYPWYFEEVDLDSERSDIVPIPEAFRPQGKQIVAKTEAMALVRYLQSLRQEELTE